MFCSLSRKKKVSPDWVADSFCFFAKLIDSVYEKSGVNMGPYENVKFVNDDE